MNMRCESMELRVDRGRPGGGSTGAQGRQDAPRFAGLDYTLGFRDRTYFLFRLSLSSHEPSSPLIAL